MVSKSIQKSLKGKTAAADKVISAVKESMSIAKEYMLDIPPNVQDIATKLLAAKCYFQHLASVILDEEFNNIQLNLFSALNHDIGTQMSICPFVL